MKRFSFQMPFILGITFLGLKRNEMVSPIVSDDEGLIRIGKPVSGMPDDTPVKFYRKVYDSICKKLSNQFSCTQLIYGVSRFSMNSYRKMNYSRRNGLLVE